MATITVRITEEVLGAIDGLVADGRFPHRSEAIRGGIDLLVRALADLEVDRPIVESYSRHPQTDEEVELARAATRALIEEEPW